MFASWFYFLLFGFLLELAATADDSVVTNSPLQDTDYHRSLIDHSELTSCQINRAGIEDSVGKKSTIAYSYVRNSTIISSSLNAAYADSNLDRDSPTDMIKYIDEYYLNRVFDSDVQNSKVGPMDECTSDGYVDGFNGTIRKSRIRDSKVSSSVIVDSDIIEDSFACISIIGGSHLSKTDAIHIVARTLEAKMCDLSHVVVENSLFEDSELAHSKVYDSEILKSNLLNSVISDESVAVGAKIKASVISKQSSIVSSELDRSIIQNSHLNKCIVINSEVRGKDYDSVRIENNVIINNYNKRRRYWKYNTS